MAINNPNNQNPQQKKGTGFVNLNRILGANTGNRLGQTIGSGIQSGVQGLQERIGEVKSGFLEEADKKNLASDTNKQAASQALQQIGSGNTNVSEDQTKQFGNFLAGQYAGPKELDSNKTAQLSARAQELQGFGQSLGSQGDKSQVLEAFVGQGKGPYSTGEKKLDAFLLGKGPNTQELQKAQQSSRGLTQQVGREQEASRQIGQLRQNQAQQFAKDVSGQIEQQKSGLENTVGQQLRQLQKEQTELYNTIRDKLDEGQALTQEERTILGLGPDQLNTYGLDLNKFLGKQQLSQGLAATATQKAQLEALSKLGQKDIRDFTEVGTQEGQYDPSKPLSFNLPELQKQAAAKKQEYDSIRSSAPIGNAAASELSSAPADDGNFSQYEFAEAVQSMPNLSGMPIDRARQELAAYEQRLAPLFNYGFNESKTKAGNIRNVQNAVKDKLNRAKIALDAQEQSLNQQFGIGKTI